MRDLITHVYLTYLLSCRPDQGIHQALDVGGINSVILRSYIQSYNRSKVEWILL